jgi:hypothetical protein
MNSMTKKGYVQPWLFGVIAGSLFVLAEVILKIYPPSAYSFCLSCHTRDLLHALANVFWGYQAHDAIITRKIVPLTSPGVLFGAFLAAKLFREYRVHRGYHLWLSFLIGFAIMLIALAIFGCPTRIALRAGYGDFYGITALAGVGLGIWSATWFMRFYTGLYK